MAREVAASCDERRCGARSPPSPTHHARVHPGRRLRLGVEEEHSLRLRSPISANGAPAQAAAATPSARPVPDLSPRAPRGAHLVARPHNLPQTTLQLEIPQHLGAARSRWSGRGQLRACRCRASASAKGARVETGAVPRPWRSRWPQGRAGLAPRDCSVREGTGQRQHASQRHRGLRGRSERKRRNRASRAPAKAPQSGALAVARQLSERAVSAAIRSLLTAAPS